MFRIVAALLALTLLVPTASADEKALADALRSLDTDVFVPGSDAAKAAASTLSRDVRARMQAANRRSTEEWRAIKTKEDWENFRDAKLKLLRESLGPWPEPPADLKVRVTGTLAGAGYKIEKLVYETRPGLLVTANLYTPAQPGKAMPGILIVHSHHNPKTQGELQDMGVLWAKQGCLVLIPDQLGHGERRQHPFKDAASYPKPFGVSRQDYYFRYNEAIQLHLAGESLMGWMVWDLMRGVDLLLARPGIDKKRIALLGSVAAGGDAAAVTAALDARITAVVPFNFGGPQPETVFPLPPDAETRINWAGSGSWESTRNLRLSARDGFLPWVIVGAAAPRGLVYAHEFAWDRDHDPMWKRLETIYGFYNARDKLAETHGYGAVTQKPTEASHANNIGAVHRKAGIYAAFKTWFDLPIPEEPKDHRREAKDLACLTPELAKEMKPLHDCAAAAVQNRAEFVQFHTADLTRHQARRNLRWTWQNVLGSVEPKREAKVDLHSSTSVGGCGLETVELEVEPGIVVPLLLLVPENLERRAAAVICVCQEGKSTFLKNRAADVAALLEAGIVVCLPDVRGTGELRAGDGRGRRSSATALSSSDLMLGQTLVGSQLRDLRSVLAFVRSIQSVDTQRIALWGTSFAKTNPHGKDLGMPLELEPLPEHAEPLGALLVLLGGLFEDEIRAVYAQNGLASYRSILDSQFVYVPHDAIVPGALRAGDLPTVAVALAPQPLRIETPVDGLNRRVSAEVLTKTYDVAKRVYGEYSATKNLSILAEPRDDGAKWLIDSLKTK